ncbi:MAG: Unknown protein, partial [uncultured Thiotrichaceae bacterium]
PVMLEAEARELTQDEVEQLAE